ncbi:hypothetical protein M0812_02156 [Anaeramoeba flamelloides]|uniref:Uncharacterized protein n=1 Tax=Anaeramoeba flamelloides TaxID=1746091 RepID=A0AAV7Z265_9EUKA|nr:hypothetical protein M0812_02156 [Anaeramoeba flamelloides]
MTIYDRFQTLLNLLNQVYETKDLFYNQEELQPTDYTKELSCCYTLFTRILFSKQNPNGLLKKSKMFNSSFKLVNLFYRFQYRDFQQKKWHNEKNSTNEFEDQNNWIIKQMKNSFFHQKNLLYYNDKLGFYLYYSWDNYNDRKNYRYQIKYEKFRTLIKKTLKCAYNHIIDEIKENLSLLKKRSKTNEKFWESFSQYIEQIINNNQRMPNVPLLADENSMRCWFNKFFQTLEKDTNMNKLNIQEQETQNIEKNNQKTKKNCNTKKTKNAKKIPKKQEKLSHNENNDEIEKKYIATKKKKFKNDQIRLNNNKIEK